jgi:ABC-2 type transport system permease protein
MLGTLFDSRGPVIGIPMTVLIGQSLLGSLVGSFVPWFPLLLPARLPELALTLALGQPLPSPLPVVATALSVVGFVLAAVWRFEREEF